MGTQPRPLTDYERSALRTLDVDATASQDIRERRNATIVALRDRGVPWRTIAEAAHLSVAAIQYIVAKAARQGAAPRLDEGANNFEPFTARHIADG